MPARQRQGRGWGPSSHTEGKGGDVPAEPPKTSPWVTRAAIAVTLTSAMLGIFAGSRWVSPVTEQNRAGPNDVDAVRAWLRSTPRLVNQDTISTLHRDGWVTVRDAVPTAVIDAFRVPLVDATTAIVTQCMQCGASLDSQLLQCHGCARTAATAPSAPKSFIKARNLHREDEVSRQFLLSQALGSIAASLLNVSAVRLYQDTAFFKEPGDLESSWHQDQAAAPVDTDRFLTLWIPLEDVSKAQGTLTFAGGSHAAGTGSPLSSRSLPRAKRVANVRYLEDADVRAEFPLQSAGSLRLGDMTAHFGWTLHRASANPTRAPRRAIALTYFEDGAHVYDDLFHVGAAGGEVRGVELTVGSEPDDRLVVQLLTDDTSTWTPWLLGGEMVPGQPIKTPLAPLVFGPGSGSIPHR